MLARSVNMKHIHKDLAGVLSISNVVFCIEGGRSLLGLACRVCRVIKITLYKLLTSSYGNVIPIVCP
jgi:hypothetical protein